MINSIEKEIESKEIRFARLQVKQVTSPISMLPLIKFVLLKKNNLTKISFPRIIFVNLFKRVVSKNGLVNYKTI